MKSLFLLGFLVLSSLATSACLTSCASSGGTGDGTYSAPPSLSPVDATDRMRSEYREWIR